jgi:nucleoside-diphosphate-sugar epimerase
MTRAHAADLHQTSLQTTPRDIAITGATGFIGRRLVARHLEAGDVVRVLSRRSAEDAKLPGCRIYRADLTKEDCDLKSFVDRVDVLYHCAGEISDTSSMRAVHVEGTRRLLMAAKGDIGRWVQLSSVGAYGPRRDGTITESEIERPLGPYETTKAAADNEVMNAAGITYTVLRPSMVFGANMPNNSLRQMIALINRGLFFFIGKPGASANYVHVENVVEALFLCGKDEAGAGRLYNLSDWRTMESFVGTIAAELGRREPSLSAPEQLVRFAAWTVGRIPSVPITQSRVDALTNRSTYDIGRIERELGFTTTTTMEDGLREIVMDWRRTRHR